MIQAVLSNPSYPEYGVATIPFPIPRDPPEIHGCTLFERCKGCPYPGHGFICWQSEDTCLRTRMNKINGLEENTNDDSSGSR